MKTVLVLPPARQVLERKDTPQYQHIGLGYIAAMLEKNNLKVKVVDAKLDRLSFTQTVELIKDLKPDILGISAMTHEIDTAAKLSSQLKHLLGKIFIVIGGVHVTALPKETLNEYPCFDAGIIGEGEYAMLELVKKIENSDYDISQIKGVVYRKGTQVLLSESAGRIEDVDLLPFPAWHQFPNASKYIIITSRGCPFSCVFCMQALGRKVRRRSAENVIEEMSRVLDERRPERFLFYDETFTLDKERVYAICDLMIKKGISKRVPWSATTRVDSIDKDILLKMKEAGCDHIEFGVESGDQKILDDIKKKITLKQAENALALAKDMNFHTEGAFILGHPNETLSTAYKTIYFAAKLNPDIAQIGIMVPYPGTEVFEMAKRGEAGYKILSRRWSDYNKQLGNALELDSLSRSDLEKLQLVGYLKLFVMNRRFRDLLKFILNYRREALSFIKNYFRKDKKQNDSNITIKMMFTMLFSSSPII